MPSSEWHYICLLLSSIHYLMVSSLFESVMVMEVMASEPAIYICILYFDYTELLASVRYKNLNAIVHNCNGHTNTLVVTRTWQSQDACALSRHCEPCRQSSWSRARNRRTSLSSQQVVWAPKVPPGPLLLHGKMPWICTPANARYPITAGWTGGAGRRQMENEMENCPELGLNSGTSGPEPRTQPLHHTHTHTHTCTIRGEILSPTI